MQAVLLIFLCGASFFSTVGRQVRRQSSGARLLPTGGRASRCGVKPQHVQGEQLRAASMPPQTLPQFQADLVPLTPEQLAQMQ